MRHPAEERTAFSFTTGIALVKTVCKAASILKVSKLKTNRWSLLPAVNSFIFTLLSSTPPLWSLNQCCISFTAVGGCLKQDFSAKWWLELPSPTSIFLMKVCCGGGGGYFYSLWLNHINNRTYSAYLSSCAAEIGSKGLFCVCVCVWYWCLLI